MCGDEGDGISAGIASDGYIVGIAVGVGICELIVGAGAGREGGKPARGYRITGKDVAREATSVRFAGRVDS